MSALAFFYIAYQLCKTFLNIKISSLSLSPYSILSAAEKQTKTHDSSGLVLKNRWFDKTTRDRLNSGPLRHVYLIYNCIPL